MDSSNLRSWEGHLANTEKLSTLIGWSKLRACSLMLLKGGFEKGMLVPGDIPLCSQILLMRLMASFDIKSLFTNIPLEETVSICN